MPMPLALGLDLVMNRPNRVRFVDLPSKGKVKAQEADKQTRKGWVCTCFLMSQLYSVSHGVLLPCFCSNNLRLALSPFYLLPDLVKTKYGIWCNVPE